MCLTPYTKPNPHYISGSDRVVRFSNGPAPGHVSRWFPTGSSRLSYLYDCTRQTIDIPCGHCPECIAKRQMYFIQRCEMESLRNHIFFCTLTYDDKHLPRYPLGNNEFVPYADFSHISDMMNRIKLNYPSELASRGPLRYLAVSERGSKKGRPHYHILFFVPMIDGETRFSSTVIRSHICSLLEKLVRRYYAVNIGTRKNPVYEPLFTYHQKFVNGKLYKNFDIHPVEPFNATHDQDVFWYVTKYLFKDSKRENRLKQKLWNVLDHDEFVYTTPSGTTHSEFTHCWNTVKSKVRCSNGLGLNGHYVVSSDGKRELVYDDIIVSRLRAGLYSNGLYPYPVFSLLDGKTFPLASYYRSCPVVVDVDVMTNIVFSWTGTMPERDGEDRDSAYCKGISRHEFVRSKDDLFDYYDIL